MGNAQEALGNVESASLEGLDDVFVSTDDQESINGASGDDQGKKQELPFPDDGLKLSEAADKYSVTERTIQRWIKEGRLIGHKVPGNHGPEWRVMGESSVDSLSCQDTITGVVEEPVEVLPTDEDGSRQQSVRDVENSVDRMACVIEKLTDQLESARKELQGASFRNGYLEAQLQAKDEQIKLLTMSPAPPEMSWLQRFGRWFIGKS